MFRLCDAARLRLVGLNTTKAIITSPALVKFLHLDWSHGSQD